MRLFAPQNLALTAWAFASLRVVHMPLLTAISAASLQRLPEFSMHHLTKLAWASAVMPCDHQELLRLLSAILGAVEGCLHEMNSPGAHSLLWALWAAAHPARLGEALAGWLRRGVDLHDAATATAVLLLDAEWRRDGEQERFGLALLRPASRSGAPQKVISKWAAEHDAPQWVAVDDAPWDLRKVGRNKPELAKYLPTYAVLEKWVQPTAGNHWDKLSAVITFVEERLGGGREVEVPATALRLLALLETFAQSREHWLKVAGGAKAELLEHALGGRRWSPHEVAVECGTFVGYSATRLAVQLLRRGGGPPTARVVTIEVDPVHACIARHLLDLAGLSSIVEVCTGQVRDVLPKVLENFGMRAIGLVFMDYKGSIFHTDLELLEGLHALGPGCVEVADNVALPGAPLLLWKLAFSGAWSLRAYAVTEFFEPNTEDWVAVAEYLGPAGAPAPPAPASWHRLSWHTDHMRRRAGGLRPTEGDMFEEDRVAYSRHVRRHFLAAGIQAQPWCGPPDDPLAASASGG